MGKDWRRMGKHDYMSVLKSVRRDLEAYEARIQEQFAAAKAALRKKSADA